MFENVITVAEDPQNLIVYAALAKAARNWEAHTQIVHALRHIEDGQTLIIQSGKPIGIMKTHLNAPMVLMANCNIVGRWATEEIFYDLERRGLICWGGLTAGDWQYIGTQGVIQGTYEVFSQVAQLLGTTDLRGKFLLTAGLGGMGGAQPLAGRLAGAVTLVVEVDEAKIDRRIKAGFLETSARSLGEALELVQQWCNSGRAGSIGLCGNAADVYSEIAARGIVPSVVTDQTSAHDLLYGYIPSGYSVAAAKAERVTDPSKLTHAALESIARHVSAMLHFKDFGAVVFDNGNLIRSQAFRAGVSRAFEIPIFTEAFLRPLFCRGIGPFRWVALSGDPNDILIIDRHLLENYQHDLRVKRWIGLAIDIPFEGLPARIAWLGHGDRTRLALEVNEMVRNGALSGPIGFTRDHLDAGAMTHPNIMTENMKDGSDAIADWPLLNALLNTASRADLVAIHSGGGGYSGYMVSSGVTLIADGTREADQRLRITLDNDTGLGVLRYADAGYTEAIDEVARSGLPRVPQ